MLKTILSEFPKVNKKHIFLEENSFDTSSNLVNSIKIINNLKWKNVGVLSNKYHLKRLLTLAKNYGINMEGVSAEDLLFKLNHKYESEIKVYYKTNDMKNIFTYEILLNNLLIIDPKGKIPKKLSESYYKFIK